jgi:hypothetical protein
VAASVSSNRLGMRARQSSMVMRAMGETPERSRMQ